MIDGADPGLSDLEDRVLALGRAGLGRGEIADRLGLAAEALARLEGERPGVRAAMARAEAVARAWWEALPREALAARVRFNWAGEGSLADLEAALLGEGATIGAP